MEKKEFKVGETFTAGFVRLKCVDDSDSDLGCEGCIFGDCSYCGAIRAVVGPCCHAYREDGKNVIFIEAD